MFGWFRREPAHFAVSQQREEKASRTGHLIAFQHHGQPVWTPRDYTALARAGYARNPIVYRCVRMIAEAAASVPWIIYQGRDELDEHPLLSLLEKPNERQGGTEFFEELYGHVLVAGNGYAEALSISDGIGELHVLRPDRMKVVPGRNGWPDAYDYTVNGRTIRFRMEEGELVRPILHLALFHPLNDHYGFAPLEAAQVSLDVHNAAGVWNKALLDNSARPSGALVYATREGGNLTDEQFERLKQELEDGFSGSGNAGRPLLLEGGLDWKAMALSPRDMDFLEAKNGAARDIALAFGVPPMLLGIPGDNTFSNYQEANRAFWRQTVLPLIGRTAKALTGWLTPAYGERLKLWYDVDQIDALSSEREALWQRIAQADFLSESEKREAVGYSPDRPDRRYRDEHYEHADTGDRVKPATGPDPMSNQAPTPQSTDLNMGRSKDHPDGQGFM